MVENWSKVSDGTADGEMIYSLQLADRREQRHKEIVEYTNTEQERRRRKEDLQTRYIPTEIKLSPVTYLLILVLLSSLTHCHQGLSPISEPSVHCFRSCRKPSGGWFLQVYVPCAWLPLLKQRESHKDPCWTLEHFPLPPKVCSRLSAL